MEHRNLKDNAAIRRAGSGARGAAGTPPTAGGGCFQCASPIKHPETAAGRDTLEVILTKNGAFLRHSGGVNTGRAPAEGQRWSTPPPSTGERCFLKNEVVAMLSTLEEDMKRIHIWHGYINR